MSSTRRSSRRACLLSLSAAVCAVLPVSSASAQHHVEYGVNLSLGPTYYYEEYKQGQVPDGPVFQENVIEGYGRVAGTANVGFGVNKARVDLAGTNASNPLIFDYGFASSRYFDSFTFDDPDLNGQHGFFETTLFVAGNGSVNLSESFTNSLTTEFDAFWHAVINVTVDGVQDPNGSPVQSGYYAGEWYKAWGSNTLEYEGDPLNTYQQNVTFEFIYGQPIFMDSFLQVDTSMDNQEDQVEGTLDAVIDLGNSSYWGGIRNLRDANGNLVTDANYSSSSGFDYRGTAASVVGQWSGNGTDTNWNNPANWANGLIPNGVDHVASFGSAGVTSHVVTIEPVGKSLSVLSFNSVAPFTIGGSGTLTFFSTTGAAQVNVAAGNHTITAPLNFQRDVTFSIASAKSSLTITGPMRTIGRTITKDGAGALRVANVRATGLNVNEGFVAVLPNGTSDATSRVESLVVAGNTTPTATLDLSDNSLIVTSGNHATLAAQVAYARNGGAWDRAGITSSTAASNSRNSTTLGVLRGDQLITASGSNLFDGIQIAPTDLIVKYTYYGDTDFNEVVNFDDYARIDDGFNNSGGDWFHGDFDGNGVVNFDDYALIDLGFNAQGVELHSAVPEPASAVVLGVATIGLYRRRRT